MVKPPSPNSDPVPPGVADHRFHWLDLAVFALAAGWICRSLPRMEGGEAWFPIVAALFLIFIHWPVRWRPRARELPAWRWVEPVLVFGAGNLLSILVLEMAGWVWAWRMWTVSRIESAALPVERSWWAWVFVFPWIPHDLSQLGWWFRLSGAAVTGEVFAGLGFPVIREGTHLLINGLPVSVDAACAGMALLQSLLVAGVILGLLMYPRGPVFFLLLPLLPLLAWLTNTARMIGITAVGLSAGVEFSQGLFHTWSGLLAIASMLALTYLALWVARQLDPAGGRR